MRPPAGRAERPTPACRPARAGPPKKARLALASGDSLSSASREARTRAAEAPAAAKLDRLPVRVQQVHGFASCDPSGSDLAIAARRHRPDAATSVAPRELATGRAGRPRAARLGRKLACSGTNSFRRVSSTPCCAGEGLERPVAQLAAEPDDDGSGRQQLVAGGVAKDRRRPLRVRVLVEHLAPGLLRVARRLAQPQRQQARPARLQLARPPKRPAAARASLSFTATTRASAAATGSSITAGSGPCRTRRRRS